LRYVKSGNSVLLDWVSVKCLGAEEPAVPAVTYVAQSNIFSIDEGICRRFAHLEANGQLFVESGCREMEASKGRDSLAYSILMADHSR
jgi:hypothetical protein